MQERYSPRSIPPRRRTALHQAGSVMQLGEVNASSLYMRSRKANPLALLGIDFPTEEGCSKVKGKGTGKAREGI